jgi:hypothetical protein
LHPLIIKCALQNLRPFCHHALVQRPSSASAKASPQTRSSPPHSVSTPRHLPRRFCSKACLTQQQPCSCCTSPHFISSFAPLALLALRPCQPSLVNSAVLSMLVRLLAAVHRSRCAHFLQVLPLTLAFILSRSPVSTAPCACSPSSQPARRPLDLSQVGSEQLCIGIAVHLNRYFCSLSAAPIALSHSTTQHPSRICLSSRPPHHRPPEPPRSQLCQSLCHTRAPQHRSHSPHYICS